MRGNHLMPEPLPLNDLMCTSLSGLYIKNIVRSTETLLVGECVLRKSTLPNMYERIYVGYGKGNKSVHKC